MQARTMHGVTSLGKISALRRCPRIMSSVNWNFADSNAVASPCTIALYPATPPTCSAATSRRGQIVARSLSRSFGHLDIEQTVADVKSNKTIQQSLRTLPQAS